MKVIMVTDSMTNKKSIYTPEAFIELVNNLYWEANNFDGAREYFDLEMLDYTMLWYETSYDNVTVTEQDIEGG